MRLNVAAIAICFVVLGLSEATASTDRPCDKEERHYALNGEPFWHWQKQCYARCLSAPKPDFMEADPCFVAGCSRGLLELFPGETVEEYLENCTPPGDRKPTNSSPAFSFNAPNIGSLVGTVAAMMTDPILLIAAIAVGVFAETGRRFLIAAPSFGILCHAAITQFVAANQASSRIGEGFIHLFVTYAPHRLIAFLAVAGVIHLLIRLGRRLLSAHQLERSEIQ